MPKSHSSSNHLFETIALTDLTAMVPFPNYLIDKVMPTLTGSEWSLLCVVVRQTLGWQVGHGGRRKLTDWLTHGQLKVRTGRSSAMVSRAVDSLVRKNLVEVRDSQQQPLLTPQARQRCGGQLYFRLSSAVLSHIIQERPEIRPAVLNANAAVNASAADQSSVPLKVKRGFIETEFQKVRTTKAIETKYLSNDKAHELLVSDLPDKTPTPRMQSTDLPNPEVKRLLATYRRLFRQHSVSGEPPAMAWGKDGKLVKGLLKVYSYKRLEVLLHQFFASEDAWVEQCGYSLAAFKSSLNRLLVQQRQQPPSTLYYPALRTGQWSRAGHRSQRHPVSRLTLPRRTAWQRKA